MSVRAGACISLTENGSVSLMAAEPGGLNGHPLAMGDSVKVRPTNFFVL